MSKQNSGYYWVRESPNKAWTVAEYCKDRDRWFLVANENSFLGSDLFEVGEPCRRDIDEVLEAVRRRGKDRQDRIDAAARAALTGIYNEDIARRDTDGAVASLCYRMADAMEAERGEADCGEQT